MNPTPPPSDALPADPAASGDTSSPPASPSDTPSPTDATGPARPARLSVAFLLRHAGHFIALGAGSGLSPVAPGTVGTLWAWLAYTGLSPWMTPVAWAWLLAAGAGVGWWACTVTARHARIADPGFIVWDEILAFWLMLWILEPAGFAMQCLAFALFRYFDAAKPGPVRWADQHFKGPGWRGGFGILFDDLVAAGCSLLVIAVGLRLWALLP